MIDHPARARVAEIMVGRMGRTGEEHTRGSGYLVSPGWVLTAHHVVKDAASVGVWLGAPPELVSEEGVGVDPGRVLAVPAADLALLPLGGPADDLLCEPALFGRLDRDPGPAVPTAAVGCPRFKLRPAPARPGVLLRELDYAIGSIAALSDAKTGRFAFAVDAAPGPDPEPDKHSSWEGMSGAAVWASGRLVGVVGQHHPGEGLATLTVCPVEQLFGSASEDQLEAWRAALPQLPVTAGNLWLATPPTVRKIEVARARRAAEALSPRVLIGRGAELAALEVFTSSGTRWRWIQGDAFAGKTALMTWFALHPPDSVDVAACFLRRASGEDTAEYALDVLTRQLALLADRRGYLPPPFPSERSNDFADLLEEAARACVDRGRRLLVLIDGLDEYDPTTASLDLADWLPGDRTLPDQAMLLAASRAGAGVRLPPAHPLSGFVERITSSEAATEIQQAAHAELDRAVRTPGGFLLPLLCCLVVAGSGLTASDMCALLKRRGRDADVSEIQAQLRSSLGRSLMRLPHPEGTGTQVYAFAHDTLLAEARFRFAGDLPTYEDLLDAWAGEYAQSDWPDGTPRYLLAPYTRELARRARDPATPDAHCGKATSGPLGQLSALARSPSRHALLLRTTGSDYAALIEIRDAQRLIAAQEVPDLRALVELAVYRHAISIRNQSIPPGLPAVWARLARFDHAEALAHTVTDPTTRTWALGATRTWALSELASAAAQAGDRDRASRLAADAEALARAITRPDAQARWLAQLAVAAAQAGDRDRASRLAADAEPVARVITYPQHQAQALAELAVAAARADDPDRASRLATDAETLARAITDPDSQARALTGLADAAAQAGDPDRAETLARDIANPDAQAQALAELAVGAAQAGDRDRASRLATDAEVLARAIPDPDSQARALAWLAVAAARLGDPHGVSRLATDAEPLARGIADPDSQAWALAWLAGAVAQAGDPDRAETLARSITDLSWRAEALTLLADAAIQATDRNRASRLAADAETLASTVTDPAAQAQALATLAYAVARAGDRERAFRLASDAEPLTSTIVNLEHRGRALTELASALARAGDPDRAETLARAITNPFLQPLVLAELAIAIAQVGDLDRAETLARTVNSGHDRARALTEVASAVARAGHPDRAETLARAITNPDQQAPALAELASAIAQAGDPDRASRLATDAEAQARTITDPYNQARALAELASAIAQAGDPDRASRLATDAEAQARTIITPELQAAALAKLVGAIARADDPDRAETLARTITDPYFLSLALVGVVGAIARAGDPESAETLARAITDPGEQATALAELASAIARAGDPDRAETLARTITDPGEQTRALTELASAAIQVGDPDRARHLLALALTVDSPEIRWQIEGVTHLFPSAIKGSAQMFARAYKTEA